MFKKKRKKKKSETTGDCSYTCIPVYMYNNAIDVYCILIPMETSKCPYVHTWLHTPTKHPSKCMYMWWSLLELMSQFLFTFTVHWWKQAESQYSMCRALSNGITSYTQPCVSAFQLTVTHYSEDIGMGIKIIVCKNICPWWHWTCSCALLLVSFWV